MLQSELVRADETVQYIDTMVLLFLPTTEHVKYTKKKPLCGPKCRGTNPVLTLGRVRLTLEKYFLYNQGFVVGNRNIGPDSVKGKA